ncbi:MAG: CbiX/SirB N-terminal domain-containing protein [Bryobacterales bacterium]
MILAAEPSARPARTAERLVRFVLLGGTDALAAAVRSLLAKPLGFEPELVCTNADLQGLDQLDGEAFLLPLSLEFGLFEKEALAASVARLRRTAPGLEAHYDDVRLNHPLLVEAFCEMAHAAGSSGSARRGVLFVAGGEGDPASRAEIYALMRNVWERLGATRGEVAFLRHSTPFVRAELERLAAEPLEWIVVPAMLERGERFAHLELIVEDQRRNAPAQALSLAQPPGEHPAVAHWVAQRALDLWRSKRQSETGRVRSAKRVERSPARRIGASVETGIVGDARDASELRALLPEAVLDAEIVFAKVTWHGYATGTFTDPVSLDALLEAIPGRVVLLEGHTSSRNDGGRTDWSWEEHALEHRAWIRAQEHAYLEKTGLSEVIRRHKATYVNVTEEYWDGRCLPDASVFDLDPEFPELAAFVPAVLAENAGAPLLSYARFKGPTRLSLSNLFGLIPAPLRARWHGPNMTHLARVCCALARLYGSIFELYGVVEGLNAAVRWDRRGLYRSRWGNYDLTLQPGLAAVSRGVVAADVLAARLQGQDPRRSAFYDTVAATLGLPAEALDLALPDDWVHRLA